VLIYEAASHVSNYFFPNMSCALALETAAVPLLRLYLAILAGFPLYSGIFCSPCPIQRLIR